MTLPEFSPVRLTTDRYVSEGVGRGAIGFILDVYDDGYEVEFSRPDGTTIAWFAVKPEDVEPAPEAMFRPTERTSV
jgi:hypothetical protein